MYHHRTTFGVLYDNNRLSTGRPSLSKPVGGPRLSLVGGRKDPRNIHLKGYQHRCITEVMKFLTQAGYEHPLSPKLLHQPSAKNFQHVFMFLYRQLDPAYVGGKFEDEVPTMLRAIGYPFDISKSQLIAVGSPHTWPVLLAMLTWLVELILACDLNAKEQPTAANMGGEKLFFCFLSGAYHQWLNGIDNFELLTAELAQKFDKQNVTLTENIKQINTQNEAMREQLAKMDSQQVLAIIQTQQEQLSSDVAKLQKHLELISAKIAKKEQTNSRLKTELVAINREIEKSTTAQKQLHQQAATQPISIERAKQVQSQHSILTESVRRIGSIKDEVMTEIWSLEIAQAKRLDQIERLVRQHNQLAEHQHQIEFGATLDQIGNTVRLAMAKVAQERTNITDELQAAEDTLFAIEAMIHMVDHESNDLEFELLQHQLQLNELQRQENDYRQLIRKVCSLQIECDNATRLAEAEKQQFTNQVLSVLDLLVQHKTHIQHSIKHL